jgi:DNA-binding NarL/FixJ family response regulator
MNNETRTKLLIADDHAIFRQGLHALLSVQPDMEIVAEVDRVDDIFTTALKTTCDVVLLDLQMDRWSMKDIERLSRIAKVVVLTASESAENGATAMRMGARAVVQKRFAFETLTTAIRSVLDGLVWMPPAVQAELANLATVRDRRLTARESEIARHVAEGLRNTDVAERLSISESTVKTHLAKIFQKLGLHDRLELAHYAIRTGLVGLIDRDR